MSKKTMGFGGEIGSIVQMAYVVKDIHEAIDWWIKKAGVGPWFLLPLALWVVGWR